MGKIKRGEKVIKVLQIITSVIIVVVGAVLVALILIGGDRILNINILSGCYFGWEAMVVLLLAMEIVKSVTMSRRE